jgi:hypothetical protein
MKAPQRYTVICTTLLALIASLFIAQNAQAYPPRKPLTITADDELIQPNSGQTKIRIRNACPAAARVVVNGRGYKSVNASRGYGSFTFGPVKPGRYVVVVKSCKEEASVVIYVPGALIIPQKHIVKRKLSIYIKYLPEGSVVTFQLGGKRVTTVPPSRPTANGLARIQIPSNTLKLGKNSVAFIVGTRIKITAAIKGIPAP